MKPRLLTTLLALCGLALLSATAAAAPQHTQQITAQGELRGHVLVIPGGAWRASGPRAVERMRPQAERFAAQGWQAHVLGYGSGRQSLVDVLAYYDQLRQAQPQAALCAYGHSAGGNLALLLAQQRPGLDCVMAVAAPTSLSAYSPHVGLTRAASMFLGSSLALRRWSPAARPLEQPALLAYQLADPVVPITQGWMMRRAATNERWVGLAPGDQPYVHGPVRQRDLQRQWQAESQLLAQVQR